MKSCEDTESNQRGSDNRSHVTEVTEKVPSSSWAGK